MLSEVCRFPNLHSFPTWCVDLELRPLPSIGITRLPRYYEPLRHPVTPGLSLTGVRLIARTITTQGFPCCVCLPLPYMPSPLPRRNHRLLFVRFNCDGGLPRIIGGSASASFFSRPAQCSLLHYGLHVRKVPEEPFTPGASDDSLPPRLLRLLPVGTKVTGRDSHPLKNSALPRRTTK
jgi:hypothetical protein